jgi:UDP-N-acetyl-D-glucosamine dehydrogenase
LGIAYKKNIDDVRESPAVRIMEILVKKEAIISYSDPYLPVFPKMREHHFDLQSVALTESMLAEQDAVIVTTAHDLFDFDFIKTHANLIIDTRGIYRDRDPKVIKA